MVCQRQQVGFCTWPCCEHKLLHRIKPFQASWTGQLGKHCAGPSVDSFSFNLYRLREKCSYGGNQSLLQGCPALKLFGQNLTFNSIQFILLCIVQQEIFTKYDVTYNSYRKYAVVVMNVQTQDRRH